MLSQFLDYTKDMEKMFSNIVGTSVYLSDGRKPIAMVGDVIMDTDRGKLLAFVVDKSNQMVIMDRDIIGWGDVIQINNFDDIIEADDIIRLTDIRKKNIVLFGNKVLTREGKVLGKVVDFSLDTNNFELKNLFVAKYILGLLQYDQRIIPASKVVEILKDKVVVEDDLEIVKESGVEREIAAA